MSTENEGGSPEYGEYGDGSGGQFEAFRARQADDRAQQETQSAYIFPPEYAADPDAMVPPTAPFGTPAGDAGRPPAASNRLRSVAVFAAAVIAACALGLGAWLAFGSSGSSADAASGSTPTSTATHAAGTGSAKHALTFRVTITSVGADSFTGTVPATGQTVTVTWTDKTHFGTKTHAFNKSDLAVGGTVAVRGRRTGTDTVTATVITAATAGSSGTTEASPTVSSAA